MTLDIEPRDDESLDRLAGDWWILQLRRGHRFSTDDLATSWRAAANRPDARRVLDLGSGIGSVGLTTLWRLGQLGNHDATLVGVEAQQVSHDLAQRTVARNRLGGRVEMRLGDIREPSMLPPDAVFDLVTGSPPYLPPGTGLLSPIPQRAHARIELRGGVDEYCEAARPRIAPWGRFVYVMAAGDRRTLEAPARHGLVVVEWFEVVFRHGRPPHIAVVTCARADEGPFGEPSLGRLEVRGPDGAWTDDYLRFRAVMGMEGLVSVPLPV